MSQVTRCDECYELMSDEDCEEFGSQACRHIPLSGRRKDGVEVELVLALDGVDLCYRCRTTVAADLIDLYLTRFEHAEADPKK